MCDVMYMCRTWQQDPDLWRKPPRIGTAWSTSWRIPGCAWEASWVLQLWREHREPRGTAALGCHGERPAAWRAVLGKAALSCTSVCCRWRPRWGTRPSWVRRLARLGACRCGQTDAAAPVRCLEPCTWGGWRPSRRFDAFHCTAPETVKEWRQKWKWGEKFEKRWVIRILLETKEWPIVQQHLIKKYNGYLQLELTGKQTKTKRYQVVI